jgi:hypothetical protein
VDDWKSAPHNASATKDFADLLKRRIGGNVEIFWTFSAKRISNAPAN